MSLKRKTGSLFSIVSLVLLIYTPVFAGGSSLTITELNAGTKIFQPGQTDQVLFQFTVKPTYADDLTISNFQLNCGPEKVFKNARLQQEGETVDTSVDEISFDYSENIPKEEETNFTVLVDVMDDVDNTVITCQTTTFNFTETATGDIKTMPEYSVGGLSDDFFPIYISAENSNKFENQVTVDQKNLGTMVYELGAENALVTEFTITANEQDLTVKDIFVVCNGNTSYNLQLDTLDKTYDQNVNAIEGTQELDWQSHQAARFNDLDLVIPEGTEQTFSVYEDLFNHQYSPYYKQNVCTVSAINFADEEFKTIDYSTLEGLGFENAESNFKVYSPNNLQGFSDVDATDPNYEAIKFLRQFNIVDGYEDGTFRPDLEVNRAELAKLLYQASWSSIGESWGNEFTIQNCFNDVADEWYSGYVCALKAKGWVDGHPDGSFKPGLTVNKVEALKMILLSQGIQVNTNDANVWYEPYLEKALEIGVLQQGENSELGKGLTRGEISEMLYRTLVFLEN